MPGNCVAFMVSASFMSESSHSNVDAGLGSRSGNSSCHPSKGLFVSLLLKA